MNKSAIIWVVVIVIIIIGGFIWWASMSAYPPVTTNTGTPTSTTSQTPTPSPTPSPTAPQGTLTTLTLNNSGGGTFGAYLSGKNGMTLYQSTKDTTNVSNCTGACATVWPPYTVSAKEAASLTANPGIAGKISTIKRGDGSLQVTYRGLPLYFYSKDMKPGDTKGEAINGFTEVAP